MTQATPEESVGPLERGLTVLRAMAASPEGRRRPSDLARETGLARSTVDRIAATLTRLGYLRSEGRDLLLAARLMELGNAYLTSCGLPDVLEPHALALADELDESVSIAVPDGDGVRFITQATRRRTMSLAFRIGDLLPAERCAPGALFAAGWSETERERWLESRRGDPLGTRFPAVPPARAADGADGADSATARFEERVRQTRARGWAVDDQLIEPGLIAVALPVHDGTGTVVCAVSVVSHTSRHSAGSLAGHALPRLHATRDAMEAALRAPVPPAGGGTPPAGGEPSYGPREGDPGAGPATGPKEELGAGFLQSLARGLTVLRVLGAGRGGLTLTEAARAAALPRATARRALITLEHLGYARADGRTYRLLPRVLELGHTRLSGLAFGEIVGPHLVSLVERVHESASISVLDGDDIRYVARVPTTRIMSVNITVGTRFPAYATSMGRVLLAGLPEPERAVRLARVRPEPLTSRTLTTADALSAAVDRAAHEGHALVDEELEEGLRSLAVPLRDRTGRVIAAVNVSQHAGRCTPEETLSSILPALAAAAARMEADLAIVTAHVRAPEGLTAGRR